MLYHRTMLYDHYIVSYIISYYMISYYILYDTTGMTGRCSAAFSASSRSMSAMACACHAARCAASASSARSAAALVAALSDQDAAVRWAAVDALAELPAADLGAQAIKAVDVLLEQNELSIAKVSEHAPLCIEWR